MTGRGSISQQFVVHNVPKFDVTRRRFTLSLFVRTIFNENGWILTLTDSVYFVDSKMFKEWVSV